MPYCKECGYEYTQGIRFCPDCQTPLVQGDRITCDVCDEVVTEREPFCHHCGVILAWGAEPGKPLHCETHRDAEVIGSCVICRRMLCDECAIKKNGRFFCDNDEHVKSAFNWAAAYTTGTDYEAEMIKSNLEGAGIPVMILSQHDHVYAANVGNLAQTEVMVPKESLAEAQRFIRSMDIHGSVDDPAN